jgi:hypothetical protein
MLAWIALATAVIAAPMTVTDLKGRSIEIELVSSVNGSVTFRRVGSPKEYTLPVSNFDQASQDLIRKNAAEIPAAMPKINADVVLGKRRKGKGDSYYMVIQEVTSTTKLTNSSTTERVKGISGTLVYVGQNTRTPDLYSVLSSQKFEASINPGDTYVKEMEAFTTSYDSDNKGTNNVGGYQYYGYVLVLQDAEGNVILSQATAGSFKLALAAKANLAKEVIAYPKGKAITDKLEPAQSGAALRIPR